jgi:hypothetical protein
MAIATAITTIIITTTRDQQQDLEEALLTSLHLQWPMERIFLHHLEDKRLSITKRRVQQRTMID